MRVGTRVASNIKKKRTISTEAKARIRNACREIRREIYNRWRLIGSGVMWFWLAMIIIGRSQQDRTRRGDDSMSVAI